MKKHHPRAPSRSHVLSILFFSVEANFQLVVAYPSRSAAARGLGVIYILFIFVSPITAPNNRKTHLHTFLPNRSSSVGLFLSLTPSFGWLLYLPIDRRPPKAKAPIFSQFFDGVYVCTPNKGTDNGEHKTATGHFAWAHRERRRQDLGPCRQLPWRERTKRLGSRDVSAHVGCCVFCVLCCGRVAF